MAKFGNGYGSERHLLRYLGRHRKLLDGSIRKQIASATEVRWLDFPFAKSWSGKTPESRWPDAEWRSLDFLRATNPAVVDDWKQRWPHGSGVVNWDAVGEIKVAQEWEWLLVEAKSHTGELRSNCDAKAANSLQQIDCVFEEVKRCLGVPQAAGWKKSYYQYANRLAVLHHLEKHGVKARFLFIYFCGDVFPNRNCPKDEAGWDAALTAQENHLALPQKHALADRIHKLFLPVWV